MLVMKARNNYIGHGGIKRMNCSQSVASAFKEKLNLEDGLVESFKACGGGNAPGGVCGAYYAARQILDKNDKEKGKEFEQYFMENAGAMECSNIKSLKKLSCIGGVEKSAGFLKENLT